MTRLKQHRFASLVGVVLVIGLVIAPPLLLLASQRADLVVLCSNAESVCQALADRYEDDSGHSVDVVRVPTSEALARLTATRAESEFDVWVGGPAEAHAQAERLGLLRPAPGIDASGLPAPFHSDRWFGIYGGILSLCVSSDVTGIRSWDDLASTSTPLVLPSPLTSGTAATMLNLHAERLGGIDAAIAYLRGLDARALSYVDSGTDPTHLVAIGRAPAGVAFDNYCRLEAAKGRPVSVVYPTDGTGFEIGAASLPRRAAPVAEAEEFLAWAVSDEGQRLAASIADQSPVSTRVEGNISSRLDSLHSVVYGPDPTGSSIRRARLIRAWASQIYLPAGEIPATATTSASAVPTDRVLDWTDLAPTAIRTGGTALAAGGLATGLGALIALATRLRPRRITILVPLTLLPALVPAAVIVEALIEFGAPAFSWWVLVLALAFNATPFAALVEWFALASITRTEILAASDLGAGERTIIRRLLSPRLASGAIPALAVTALMAASDTSAPSACGGPEPYLSSLARAALNSGLGPSITLGIASFYGLAALVTTMIVMRTLTITRYSPRRSGSSDALAPTGLLRSLTVGASTPIIALAAANALVTGMILRGAARTAMESALAQTAPSAIRESALILLVIVPVSTLIGFIAARIRWRHPYAVNSVFLTMMLASPVAGGITIHALHRHPVSLGGWQIIPPLVGAGSPGGGLIGVVLANLILSVPAAYFLMSFALAGTREAAAAARDAGASPLRVTLEILIPAARGRLIAAVAALSALIMCMSAPSVFVVPVGSAFPAVALVPLGVHGDADGVFLLGALGGASALAMIAVALIAIVSTTRRSSHGR